MGSQLAAAAAAVVRKLGVVVVGSQLAAAAVARKLGVVVVGSQLAAAAVARKLGAVAVAGRPSFFFFLFFLEGTGCCLIDSRIEECRNCGSGIIKKSS